jgi:hypothetical protein
MQSNVPASMRCGSYFSFISQIMLCCLNNCHVNVLRQAYLALLCVLISHWQLLLLSLRCRCAPPLLTPLTLLSRRLLSCVTRLLTRQERCGTDNMSCALHVLAQRGCLP